jgi:hypothetical protein
LVGTNKVSTAIQQFDTLFPTSPSLWMDTMKNGNPPWGNQQDLVDVTSDAISQNWDHKIYLLPKPNIMPSQFDSCQPLQRVGSHSTMKQPRRDEHKVHASARFAPSASLEQVRYTISRHDMTATELLACWWTLEEQEACHHNSRTIVKRTKHHKQNEEFVTKTLNRSYHKACRAVNKGFPQGSRSFLSDCDVASVCSDARLITSRSLSKWVSHCEARRGLEKYLITDERSIQATIHRENVLTAVANAFIFESSDSCIDTSSVSTTLDDEMVADFSLQTSAISRVFARMVGEADANFVKDHC